MPDKLSLLLEKSLQSPRNRCPTSIFTGEGQDAVTNRAGIQLGTAELNILSAGSPNLHTQASTSLGPVVPSILVHILVVVVCMEKEDERMLGWDAETPPPYDNLQRR